MNSLNRKKIGIVAIMILALVITTGITVKMNKAKASGNVVIDGITWGFVFGWR